MADTPQTFANHGRLRPPFHLFVLPVLLINVFYALWNLIQLPAASTAWAAVVAAALLALALSTRGMAVTIQDRVIRMEMRHRLKDVLPWDLHGRIVELTPQQLIALRFASDDEMPQLVRDVLAGELVGSKAIKQRVKNWQGDYLRC